MILPFPGGVVRSGSKVGSKYKALVASTNDAYCPTLRGTHALGAARRRRRGAGDRHRRARRAEASRAPCAQASSRHAAGGRGGRHRHHRRQLRRQARPASLPSRGRCSRETRISWRRVVRPTERRAKRGRGHDRAAFTLRQSPPSAVDVSALRPSALAGQVARGDLRDRAAGMERGLGGSVICSRCAAMTRAAIVIDGADGRLIRAGAGLDGGELTVSATPAITPARGCAAASITCGAMPATTWAPRCGGARSGDGQRGRFCGLGPRRRIEAA